LSSGHLDEENKKHLFLAVEELAASGLRVLGVAKAKINAKGLPEIQHDFKIRIYWFNRTFRPPFAKMLKEAVSVMLIRLVSG